MLDLSWSVLFITQIKNHISKIKILSETNLGKINQVKIKRLELGGANAHKEQVDSIPDCIFSHWWLLASWLVHRHFIVARLVRYFVFS